MVEHFGFVQYGIHYKYREPQPISGEYVEQIWVPKERVTREELISHYLSQMAAIYDDVYLVQRITTAWERTPDDG